MYVNCTQASHEVPINDKLLAIAKPNDLLRLNNCQQKAIRIRQPAQN
jgi:hypothetical protein